ncbi:MAG: cell division FtsA domain-containing protein [Clostridia bacterium]|nr:cell division FtsA domain-containing protein [Clostridia bacterium]
MKPAAILDIGSSKVVCLLGSAVQTDGIVVHGAGVAPYDGFSDGEFLDRQSLHTAVVDAISKAEAESCMRIRDVALTVPSCFAKLSLADATITLGSRPRRAEGADVDRLISHSLKRAKMPEGYVLMHSTPVFFLVDGISSTEVPIGLVTDELSGLISHMFVKEDYIKAISDTLDEIGVEISMCISSSLGEAVMLIPETERVRPAVLIDVGYYHTDVCIIESAALTGMATLPIGGYHFTNDLSFGLDVPFEIAEQAKRRYVFSLDYKDRTEVLRSEKGSKRVSFSAISMIVEARADELCTMIREAIEDLGVNVRARPAAYLSGGGFLMMRGALDFMKKSLHLTIKRDMPFTPRLSSPNYCSAFGALNFVLRAGGAEEELLKQDEPEQGSRLLKKVKEFFTK